MTSLVEPKLPPLSDGDLIQFQSVQVVEKKTKPPVRYTEGTLLDDMQSAGKYVDNAELRKILKTVKGLGTAATRAATFETLKGHKYLEKKGKNFVPTEKAMKFIDWISKVCPELVDVAETARWEAELELVAEKGGGSKFEAAIAQKVINLVAILKNANGIALSGPPDTNGKRLETSMSETRKPSEKQLSYAQSIATRFNLKLTDAIINDMAACSAFIDEHAEAANAPTEKQIALVNRIAKDKGIEVPASVLKDKKQVSAWIDANK